MFDIARPKSTALIAPAALVGLISLGARAQQAAAPQQPPEISATITGQGGEAPRLAVPEFIPLTRDAETQAIARTITQVLADDLAFEREFALISRDVLATVPAATSFDDVPFDRWRELNADGVVV